jgi:ribosomal protein S18 acetylase RimI-like enzyme
MIAPRRARAEDLPQIVALLADDFIGQAREDADSRPNPRYLTAFEAISRDPNQCLAVLEDEGKLVGCLQISFIPGLSRTGLLRGQIESVRIAGERRGEGLGRRMLEWAIDQCRERGCGLVQLTTDKRRTEARRLYEQLGFMASHEGMKLTL